MKLQALSLFFMHLGTYLSALHALTRYVWFLQNVAYSDLGEKALRLQRPKAH